MVAESIAERGEVTGVAAILKFTRMLYESGGQRCRARDPKKRKAIACRSHFVLRRKSVCLMAEMGQSRRMRPACFSSECPLLPGSDS